MNSLRFLCFSMFVSIPLLAAGCLEEEDEVPIWEDYCYAAEECAMMSGQMFSMTECRLEYKESFERHESIGCDRQFEYYLMCAMDLSCPAWSDVSDACAWEIDSLNSCVQ